MNKGSKFYIVLTLIIMTMLIAPLNALGETVKVNMLHYVALGDSLTAGQTPYKDANGHPQYDTGYVDVIVENMVENHYEVTVANEGKSGLTSEHLKTMVLDPAYQEAVLKEADIITLTIGANDILGALDFTNFTLKEGADAKVILGNLHVNLNVILDTIKKVNADAKVYVMGYYNPFEAAMTQMPEENEKLLLSLLQGLNQSIQGSVAVQAQAGQQVQFVPTAELINAKPVNYVPNPADVHLSKEGYRVVAEAFWKAMNLPEAGSGSLTIPNVELPANHKHPVARLYARQDLQLVKKGQDGKYTFYKNLNKGQAYRVYGTKGMYYHVGGAYYIKYEKGLNVYIGRTLIKQSTPLYDQKGKVSRMLKPGEAIRVYSYGIGKYQVGGGYYIEDTRKISYIIGYVTIKEDTVLYKPNGQKHSILKKGKQYMVKHINGIDIDLGGGFTVKDDSKVTFHKN